jgi:hypothetical protein
MGASIDGWLVGGVALGIFVFTRWLLKNAGEIIDGGTRSQ